LVLQLLLPDLHSHRPTLIPSPTFPFTAKDATEDFDEIGHSKTAQEMLEKYLVGIFTGGDPSKLKNISFKSSSGAGQSQQSSFLVTLIKALLPLIILALAIYMSQSGK
jgi:cytochrome b5